MTHTFTTTKLDLRVNHTVTLYHHLQLVSDMTWPWSFPKLDVRTSAMLDAPAAIEDARLRHSQNVTSRLSPFYAGSHNSTAIFQWVYADSSELPANLDEDVYWSDNMHRHAEVEIEGMIYQEDCGRSCPLPPYDSEPEHNDVSCSCPACSTNEVETEAEPTPGAK